MRCLNYIRKEQLIKITVLACVTVILFSYENSTVFNTENLESEKVPSLENFDSLSKREAPLANKSGLKTMIEYQDSLMISDYEELSRLKYLVIEKAQSKKK